MAHLFWKRQLSQSNCPNLVIFKETTCVVALENLADFLFRFENPILQKLLKKCFLPFRTIWIATLLVQDYGNGVTRSTTKKVRGTSKMTNFDLETVKNDISVNRL